MSGDTLTEALPDLVIIVGRDGLIERHAGGRGFFPQPSPGTLKGRRLEEVWSETAAQSLRVMLRRALSTRAAVEGQFSEGALLLGARIAPLGPQRVMCVIRPVEAQGDDAARPAEASPVERRGFLGRLRQSVADAALKEQPLAVCLIYLEGLDDIGRAIDFSVSDRVGTAAMVRLDERRAAIRSGPPWYLGQLGDGLLALVVTGTAERDALRALASDVCTLLAEPIRIGDATFHLQPRAGVALLGRDASQPQALLEQARSAMLEARRAGKSDVEFCTDTLRMRQLSRVDVERELREAITTDQLSIHYQARHELATGRRVALQAYLRWRHPLRGEVRPAEFLPVAEGTGLAALMSRWAVRRLQADVPQLRRQYGPDFRVSFGALRQHLSSDALVEDVAELLRSAVLPAGGLELRIHEKTVATLSRSDRVLRRLADLGAILVIDEFGRGYSSLARLAHYPFELLQIDRSFVEAIDSDAAALKVCRAAVGIGAALGLQTVAAGVDSMTARDRVLDIGCTQGLGDLYDPVVIAPAQDLSGRATA